MSHEVGEATGFGLVTSHTVKVIFPGGYEILIVAQAKRELQRRAVRTVQLLHDSHPIAQYDGVIARTSPGDPYEDIFNPHAMVFGDPAQLATYWESAVRFVAQQHTEFMRKKTRVSQLAKEDREIYRHECDRFNMAATAADSGSRDLRLLKRFLKRREK